MAVHVYNWHAIPFDTDYPDYFPTKPGVPEMVRALRDGGVGVFPYINARLWDVNAPSWRAEGAERWAAQGSAQRAEPRTLFPYLEEYGSGQKLAAMCPATEFWQEKVAAVCERIKTDLGVSGIYLDQVGAASALLCFDPEHGHPLGGGEFWTSAYGALMDRVRGRVGDDFPLLTECNAETCIGDFDALLTWHCYPDRQQPMFPAAYGGRAVTFGTSIAKDDWTGGGESYAAKMAQLYVWGAQLGWSDVTPVLEAEKEQLLAFTKRLCACRRQASQALRGEMVRPPVVQTDAEPITVHWSMGDRRYDGPIGPVLASCWAAPDGAPWLLTANPTRRKIRAKIACGEREHGREMAPFSVVAEEL
jgi:hypothetical protein